MYKVLHSLDMPAPSISLLGCVLCFVLFLSHIL